METTTATVNDVIEALKDNGALYVSQFLKINGMFYERPHINNADAIKMFEGLLMLGIFTEVAYVMHDNGRCMRIEAIF